mgnify:FL=1
MLHQACFSCSGNSYQVLAKRINNNSDIVFLTNKLNKNLRSSVKIYELITSKLNEIYKEIKDEPIDTFIKENEFRCCWKSLSDKKMKYMRAVNLNAFALGHIIKNKEYFDKSEQLQKELLEYMNIISGKHDEKYGRYCFNWKGLETYKKLIFANI